MNESSKGLVIVVEDEPELLRGVCQEITASGLNTIGAKDGVEALELIKKNKPHAILTDLAMPHMNGIELVQELRRLEIETPCIILTAHIGKESILQAIRLGVADFIEKPFEFQALLAAVQKATELGLEIEQLENELDQICAEAKMSAEEKKTLKQTKIAALIMSKTQK